MSGPKDIYEQHHKTNREAGFSILKEERGELLKELIGTGKMVLDIGCRDGALTKHFIHGNQVLGVDIDEVALKEAAKLGIQVKSMDLGGDWSELQGLEFDVVVAGEVLEHLYFPGQVLTKIIGHLKPGGKLIGSVPNAFSVKNRLRYLRGSRKHTPLYDPTHINHFSAQELRGLLREYFSKVTILGLGRYKRLAKLSPNLFSFDLFFVAQL